MVNVTLSIPTELKHKMEKFAEINWSAVAREAFNEKINDLEFIKKFKIRSTLSEEDAINLGKELNNKLLARRK
jgi:hypothetical protein